MATLKTALILDWPSADASVGPLSKWEAEVVADLQRHANFHPALVTTAFPTFVAKPANLWVNGKVGLPTPAAKAAQDTLCTALAGYDTALTMGAFALWATTNETKLSLYRGTHIDSPLVPGLQVIPTYSVELFTRTAWHERPMVLSAMRKATSRFLDKPRTIYVAETIADLYDFARRHIDDRIVFDVETNIGGRITEFSLAPSSSVCLYVQLEDHGHNSLWSAEDELAIWQWLAELAARPTLAWGFHNATYDLSYLDAIDIRPLGPIFDTMLEHHAYQPEWEKSLGFLASLHVPTRAWKHLRTKAKNEFNKAGAIE